MSTPTEPGRPAPTASLAKRPREVAAMFDQVARRYDLTNSVLTAGIDHRWRKQTRRALALSPGQLVLDIAAGTGVSTAEIANAGVRAVACDFSVGMLSAGRRRPERASLPFVAGDALALPFADAVFDAVTVSFGLRNMVDVDAALAEFARVTRPGGTLVVCEFSVPPNPLVRRVYVEGVLGVLPWVARRVSSHGEAYSYLRDSVRAWPTQAELARRVAGSGWGEVHWRNLTFGVVALHKAIRR